MLANNKKFEKQSLILILILIFTFGLLNLSQGYSLIGKTFPGFSIGFTLITSPTTKKDWTGYSANFKVYDRIISVNGERVNNVEKFDEIIQQKAPGTPVNYTFLRNNKLLHNTVNTMEFTLKDFITTFLSSFIISLAFLLMSLFIILKGNNDESVKTLLIFSLLISLSFCILNDIDFTHRLIPMGYFIQILSVASLVHLGLIINKSNLTGKVYNLIFRTNIFLTFLMATAINITALIIRNDLYAFPSILKLHFISFNLLVYYFACSFLIFTGLIAYSYLKSPAYSLQKMQSRIILTGSILAFMPYIVFWLLPTIFGYKSSIENLLLTFLAFPFFITYAIIRYKAFDIEVFIRKGLVYSTLSGILVISYFTLSTLLVVVWQKMFNITDQTPIAFSAIIATIITSKLNKNIQTVIDKAFYRQKFDFTLLLEKFINEIPKIFERKALVNTCFSYIENTVNPVFAAFYLFDRQEQNFKLIGTNNINYQEDMIARPLASIKDISSVLNNYDLSDSMVLPLQKEQEIIGLLILGKKKSEVEYLFEEKNFLKNFAVGTSMALDNLMLKEESFALSVKNVELENKADFLNNLTANLSHDLKFPLSSSVQILNKISYMLDKKASITKDLILTDINKLYKALGKINEYISISLDREMISLGKLVMVKKNVNIRQACEDAIFLHTDYLEKKEIKVIFEFPEEELFIYGDRVRFEHVISNLVSNAAKYGGQMIKIKIEKTSTASGNFELILTLEDNGPGIKENIKDKVFERYVQSGIVSNSGTDRSTGLGLFICKTYIEMMNGSIWFESGNGTKFFIKLPLVNESQSLVHLAPVSDIKAKNISENTGLKISVTEDLVPEYPEVLKRL